jgi:hypothetical protein
VVVPISFRCKIDRTSFRINIPYVAAQSELVDPVSHLTRKVEEGRGSKIVLGATRVENMNIALRTRDLHPLEFRHRESWQGVSGIQYCS